MREITMRSKGCDGMSVSEGELKDALFLLVCDKRSRIERSVGHDGAIRMRFYHKDGTFIEFEIREGEGR